jgi:class 3 adenylate cyclase/tetratricopeptide (TPR) repeat protein
LTCGREIDGDFAFCPHCGAELAAVTPSGEHRKTVTVLFCDVTGSTALGESVDPEALRGLLARYFDRMKAIVERHGGSVEKFIGDAVMAVFGVPVAHEDDALRAVRAAADMREAMPDLGIQARVGVNTGEVVTGTEERLATGDAVNVAARLEQAAQPGEVLIGGPTLRLVREAVEVEPVEPLELKGKAKPVQAYRLHSVREAPERRHETPFVGREREVATLREAWERVQTGQRCEQATVVGDAGVGKSRLVAEALASIEGRVLRGRCLPYGEGITYWPVVEVLKQLDRLPKDESAAAPIRSLLGESGAPTSAEEIAWAFRKTLEQAAAEQPIVVVFDDIQWGEDTFLDLIEQVALLSSGVPILLLCMARPEIAERRPAWPTTLRLQPLDPEQVDELMPENVSGDLRRRIAKAAGGNPLFIEEMLAIAEAADGEVVVPPTLQALLAARLDQLDTAERSVLERGAVEGEIFHRGAVQALSTRETQVTARLAALVRKELIRPERPQLPGEDGFRFRHILIRDAAYAALPKATRADLHRRFAAWLEERRVGLVELDEIAGYHLEQAHRYRVDLGLPSDEELTTAARGRLTAAGRRAHVRGDYRAALSLLERAAGLVPPEEIDLALETALVDALFETGRANDALARSGSLAERAAARGDRVAELCARVQEAMFRTYVEPEGATERLSALLDEALPVFEKAGEDLPLHLGYYALAQVDFIRLRMDPALKALDRAVAHARELGATTVVMGWRSGARVYGSTPVKEALGWLDEQEEGGVQNVLFRRDRAALLAMLGHFDQARSILQDVRTELADRAAGMELGVALGQICVDVELLAGDPVAAAEVGEEGCTILDGLGEHSFLSTAAASLGRAYYELGRFDDAEAWAGRAAELGASDDMLTQTMWRRLRAKVLGRRGDHAEAERLARGAIAMALETDSINEQADAYADLADVLALAGREQEADAALRGALALYERKGNVVRARRTRDRLAASRKGLPP